MPMFHNKEDLFGEDNIPNTAIQTWFSVRRILQNLQLFFPTSKHLFASRVGGRHEVVFFFVFCFLNFGFIYLFIYLWLCWVFVSVRGLSLVAASGGHSSSQCTGLSLSWPLLLRSTGSRRAGAVIVAHGPSCSAACGIFPDQCLNPCPLHWQADSQQLCHQGSPNMKFFDGTIFLKFFLSHNYGLNRRLFNPGP